MYKKKNKKCSACGTSPVNHRLLFISSFLDETLGKIQPNFTKGNSGKTLDEVSFFVERILILLMRLLGILHFGKDKEKACTGRSKLIWEEAKRRSIHMEQFIAFGKPIEQYRAKINGKYFNFSSLPIPPWMPQGDYDWIDDKYILLKKLGKEGIPVPKTYRIISKKKSIALFKKMNKPLIVKPKSGSRGRHTTTNINTEEDLLKALALSREINLWSVLQEHLFGGVCRATVVDNKLVGFFRALPPTITGDGIKTIKELIDEANKKRPEKISEIFINDDLLEFINRQGYSLQSILSKQKQIDLSAKTGRMYGGYTEEIIKDVHPKMHEIFRKISKVVNVPVAGFDLIIEDPTKDPDNQRWGIIECNSMPFIDLHYFAFKGEPVNLAKNIWDLWNKK